MKKLILAAVVSLICYGCSTTNEVYYPSYQVPEFDSEDTMNCNNSFSNICQDAVHWSIHKEHI